MARRTGKLARRVRGVVVLQRFIERSAPARSRVAPGGGGPGRHPAQARGEPRLADHQPQLDANSKLQIPNSKQPPLKLCMPNVWRLVLGAWCLFVIWCLGFGA